MPTVSSSAESARRAFDTLLRNNRSGSVMLRIPAPAAPGDATEQLGLAVPRFQDVELSPVVFRKTSATTAAGKDAQRDLLISATAVQALSGSHHYGSAAALFASAFGVLVDDALLAIVSATELEVGGQICGYCLTVRETAAATVLN
jgi:hypothetical protein